MADDPTKRGPQDRSRINVHEPWEVQYWSDRLGVTPERLRDAVKQVGVSAEAVQEYLARQQVAPEQ